MQSLLEREIARTETGGGLFHSAHLECQEGPFFKMVCGLEETINGLCEQCPPGQVECVVCSTPPLHCPVCGVLLVANG